MNQVLEPGKSTLATEEHLYNLFISSFRDRGIPDDNIIGFASDGCNVMMGARNSVVSRLKKDFSGLTVIKCTCRSLAICAGKACKKLPRSPEQFARNIDSFFSSSAKRQSEFMEFQMFMDTEPHKMLHPAQTRWLSLTAVVERILEQWEPLKLYFDDQWQQEKTIAAESIFNSLHDPFTKLYL